MSATVELVREVLVITPTGRLDSVSSPSLDAELAPYLKQPHPRIVLDLAGVSYASSAGLRTILQLVKHTAAHGGRLALAGVSANVMEVIEISGFTGMMDIYEGRDAVLGGSEQ